MTSASIVTAATIAKPWNAIFQNGLTLSSVKPSSITPMKSAPRTAPSTVPTPPKTLTPPITTAEITSNSNPDPEAALTFAKRAAYMNPPSPASEPLSAKASITLRPTGIPEYRAASGLEPIA